MAKMGQAIGPTALDWPLKEHLHLASISSHSRQTWLCEMPLITLALTSSSTERVDTPWTKARGQDLFGRAAAGPGRRGK
jgi:hypothetical protein